MNRQGVNVDDYFTLHQGDCCEVMATFGADSIDAIVCDPPYGLSAGPSKHIGDEGSKTGFMGKAWDHGVPGVEFWTEALRVAKPGAYLMAFGGTRTFHRLAVAIEDAGWEMRDCVCWLYGSGFPKSLDVSKAMDRAAGEEREVVGTKTAGMGSGKSFDMLQAEGLNSTAVREVPITAPATDAARQWQGYGTALKPAHEPIILARKPLARGLTVAANVLRYGTGAINVDGCRVPVEDGYEATKASGISSSTAGWDRPWKHDPAARAARAARAEENAETTARLGRWPANVCHDGSPEVLAGFPITESGVLKAGTKRTTEGGYHGGFPEIATHHDTGGDSGSAARFFYTAKASRDDREAGLDTQKIVVVECAAWELADQKATLRVDTAVSPPRVIAVSGAPCNDVSVWSTFLFGSGETALFQRATTSTTSTGTRSTTGSRTSNWFRRWFTSASTVDANGEAESGGSLAESAESSRAQMRITSALVVSARGVERAASPTQWKISEGGSPASHPTVKPTDLMRWLVRLVGHPGCTILDPFMGSGSTGKAARLEGFRFVGIDREAEYVEIARARIEAADNAPDLFRQEAEPRPRDNEPEWVPMFPDEPE